MLTIRAVTGGAGYAQRHLEYSDYYDELRKVQGEWHGRGAELLGLRGTVTREQFEAVREALHPQSGEFLRPRHSSDRTNVDGSEQSKARSLYDLTFSAPKSVSVQALVGGDERLVTAHDKAVREALAEAESHAATRVRLNGANEDRTTANFVVASYRHDTSRELDPQLHTHAVAANLTYDGAEGRWKALQASGLYERRAYLTEVYRNALAREVRGLGYEIEPRRDPKGKDHGFEIHGVSTELLEKYSVRSAQRDAAIEQFTLERGRKPTDNEVAVLVRESRADKLAEIATEKVREQQQARLAPNEQHTLQNLRSDSQETPRILHEPPRAAESLQFAKEHLFERNSVVRDHELMAEALRHGRGQIDRGELRGALEVEQAQGGLIRAGNDLATRESLEREQRMIAVVSVSLTGVQRQTQAEYRDAIQTLRQAPEQGFQKLEQLGAIREVPYLERPQAVASAYRKLTTDPNRKVLVVAGTHEEIGRITHAIRESMKQSGELGPGKTFERNTPLQWTEAQKKDLSNYQPGQVLLFHRSSHGIARNDALVVERSDRSHIIARDLNGVERLVSPTQARSFSVQERGQIEISPGDRLLLTGNRREADFRATNGELAKVRSIDACRIQLEDGRTLPANYREFNHGYAITAHRSQGKTVDAVVLSGDMMKQEQFYVAASRGRDGITVITSDVDQLRATLGTSSVRPSATELAREQAQTHPAHEHEIALSPAQKLEPTMPRNEIALGHDLGMSL